MVRLSREAYTVGWVCALPIELAAAQALLNEEHDDLEQGGNDSNIYTLGAIGKHNVVLACLPAGQTGIGAAAAVATQLKATFKWIRFGLMVGIGGGVPSQKNDIRLGDVVISQPDQGHGGVIQYDFGKATPTGFMATGFLNAPPQVLLSAVSKMRARHLGGRKELDQYVSKACEKEHLAHFTRESAGPDCLFEASYNHVEGLTYEQCGTDHLLDFTRVKN